MYNMSQNCDCSGAKNFHYMCSLHDLPPVLASQAAVMILYWFHCRINAVRIAHRTIIFLAIMAHQTAIFTTWNETSCIGCGFPVLIYLFFLVHVCIQIKQSLVCKEV